MCRHRLVPANPEHSGKSRFCNDCRKMVDISYYIEATQRSAYVHTDNMNPLLNHADGKVYDSKSSFRRATHNAGYREVGNDGFGEMGSDIRGDFNCRSELREAVGKYLK